MPIDPREFSEHEAWLLFQLNDAPIRTEADGDFKVLAIMDVATGVIVGMEIFSTLLEEPSAFEARKLLATAESEVNGRPKCLFVGSGKNVSPFAATAKAMGIEAIPQSGSSISRLTKEAREGFADHGTATSLHSL